MQKEAKKQEADAYVISKAQKGVLITTAITAFLTTFSSSSMELSIPNMESDFGVTAAVVGWIISAYIITTAAMSIPFGKIADMKGRRRVLLTGIGGFGAASIVCAAAVSFPMLITFRVIQGIFASMIFATNNAILISVFPGNMRGKVLGISISATYIGLSAGPVLGGLLNHYVGWRSIFVIAVILAGIALSFGLKNTPDNPVAEDQGKLDLAGYVLLITSVAFFLYGLTNLSVSSYSKLILALGLVLGIVFVRVELSAESPVVKMTMFTKSKAFTFSNLAALLNYGATFAISYVMSIYLQVVKGCDSQVAGLIMVCMPGFQAIFTPKMGQLSDRIAPHKLASSGMAVCACSLFAFSWVNEGTPIPVVMAILACAGFSFALFSSPNTNAIMSTVSKEDYASANSILATMRTIGQSTSMAVVTIIVGMVLGNTTLKQACPEDLIRVMHITFLTFMGLCLVGIYLSLQRSKSN